MTNLKLAEAVLETLQSRNETVSTAESCTGGLLAAYLTDVPGASRPFMGGIVAYAEHIKTECLNVSAQVIKEHGVVSEQIALLMAQGSQQKFNSHWALSTTGFAGPTGGTPEAPVGTLCIAIAGPHGAYSRTHILKDLSRDAFRKHACELLLAWFLSLLK